MQQQCLQGPRLELRIHTGIVVVVVVVVEGTPNERWIIILIKWWCCWWLPFLTILSTWRRRPLLLLFPFLYLEQSGIHIGQVSWQEHGPKPIQYNEIENRSCRGR